MCPLAFCSISKVTYDQKGCVRVSIQQHGSGLDKRQFSLHLIIRPRGKQVWPFLIMKVATTADGREDTQKRAKEMEKYKEYNVHVLWQKHAWLDRITASSGLPPLLREDMKRLNLLDDKKLMMADNLDSQRTQEHRDALGKLNFRTMYGPEKGTEYWQAVDHGVGSEYQDGAGEQHDAWCQGPEAIEHFHNKTAPTAERRRELMVIWIHRVYNKMEEERERQEDTGGRSIFELAFLRTGCMVSANGAEVDKEIKPEGMETAIKNSTDSYYKDHSIETFRDLLKCSDLDCGHVPHAPPPPSVDFTDRRTDKMPLDAHL